MKGNKLYKVIGAYDSETTNIDIDGLHEAFPVLHQLGIIDCDITEIDAGNVEAHTHIEIYRHASELYTALDDLVSMRLDFTPVIMCHNLSFDMYGLAPWLSRQKVRVLAKSARKPITFSILDDSGKPRLIIWDTLIFTQTGLERMGEDCGYHKAVGEWDYGLIRTPGTYLTPDEVDYSKKDIYTLITYISWWLRRNEDIRPERLGLNVVTKTGVVRERRRVRFDHVKGKGQRFNVGRYWLYLNREQAPKTDDELFTMQAATRGGFTFCASSAASVPYELAGTGQVVAAYDATSQHPAQMVSHRYPVNFKEATPRLLNLMFKYVSLVTLDDVLAKWANPFHNAFYACFRITNLRPKKGSMFARYGVYPLASARYRNPEQQAFDEQNGDRMAQEGFRYARGYVDSASNAVFEFGKVVSADWVNCYITELSAWEICQCYDFDSVEAVHGYATGKFVRPTDMATISVMQFYKAKNLFKNAREEYYEKGSISNVQELLDIGISPSVVQGMAEGNATSNDVEACYLGLKADLNALFGIEASNEYRRDTVMGVDGIAYTGDFGICNAPKNPKAWYQFGQRIVGWSRIAQLCVLMLVEPWISQVVNGDTDSVKVIADASALDDIAGILDIYARALDRAKEDTCKRVERAYPDLFDPLDGIGHYILEFTSDAFCASWNKAYCQHDIGKDGKRHYDFTLAGIPTRKRQGLVSSFIGVNGYADRLDALGWSFGEVCDLLLGYNVTLAYDVIRMNGRSFPQWGDVFTGRVVDHNGESELVAEPRALALYPMGKTINDTSRPDNLANYVVAKANRPGLDEGRVIVHARGVTALDEII